MKKDELVHEIGNILLDCHDAKSATWEALVYVGEIRTGGQSGYGFIYLPDGKVKSFSPGRDVIFPRIKELHSTMNENWKFCLIMITPPGKISIDFDYAADSRLKMTPANLEKLKEELRPKN